MKKIIACFLALGFASHLPAQNSFYTLKDLGGNASQSGSRTILCPPGSIYSHEVNYDNGISSQEAHFIWYDQIETSPDAPIHQIVFFGNAMDTPHRDFTIKFYHDNGGVPGAIFASYSSFLTGVSTGEFLFDMEAFSYTYNLPTGITFNAGDWVSVVAANTGGLWYWLTASPGDGCIFNEYMGSYCELGDVAFCLIGGPGGPEVPIASWALGIGIALIAASVILRYRRIP